MFLQDLEAYAASYTGLARLNRLMYIADHCPPLKVEALRMALAFVMTTFNTNAYQEVHKKLQSAISRYCSGFYTFLLKLLELPGTEIIFLN